MLERECAELSAPTCAHRALQLISAPRRRPATRTASASWRRQNSSAAAPGEPIMIINYVAAKPCRESHSLSGDLLDLYHLKSQRSLAKQSIIFRTQHFTKSSRRWCHTIFRATPSFGCRWRNHNEAINSKCVHRNPPMMINVINQSQEIKQACVRLQGVECGCVTLFSLVLMRCDRQRAASRAELFTLRHRSVTNLWNWIWK